MKNKLNFYIFIIIIALLNSCTSYKGIKSNNKKQKYATNLYWFIPDGLRAEPDLFNIYKWAEEGKLPNIKKMMEQGSYGYSLPVFPTHTPVNFATLLTGTTPKTHGVADGPMHVEGRQLSEVSIGGFSSVARKIPAAWSLFEKENKKVLLMSIPGSTPPEIEKGIIIRGRWGGWGADFHAINFESKLFGQQWYKQAKSTKLFFNGPELTKYIDPIINNNWNNVPKSYSEPLEIPLTSWGNTIYALIIDTSNDQKINYNQVLFSIDKEKILCTLNQSDWSNWYNINLKWKENIVPSNCMFNIIKLDENGFFRIRVLYNNINKFNTQPSEVASELTNSIGPMVDFVDNFPPQLIYYNEDKKTFIDEMNLSFDWHNESIKVIRNKYNPDVIIDDIYNPNQMLTSKWWLGYIDSSSTRYNDITNIKRDTIWNEVLNMYKKIDSMIGTIINTCDENTLIVLSSDHGAAAINKSVRLNNLFAKNNYLKFTIDSITGIPTIDWKNTRVVYLKMMGIYINPKGLEGNWIRSSGNEYENLRDSITMLLKDLKDENNIYPVTSITKWENVKEFLDLPADRCGDLIISNKTGYGWNEEVNNELAIFDIPIISGYKQAIKVDETKSMWTPFIAMGPGVKKGNKIKQPIRHIDQLPTILKIMNIKAPSNIEGKVVNIVEK